MNGLDLAAHNIVNATTISFSGAAYAGIAGAATDILRIGGGGTVGGMIIAGSEVGGVSNLIRFRQYTTSNIDAVSIDPASGDIVSSGGITAAGDVSSRLDLDVSGAPTVAGCGSGATVSGGSKGGAITLGAGFSGCGCAVTFATAYPNAAYCTLTGLTSAGATIPQLAAMSRTGFTFNGASSGSYIYVCSGR